MAPPTLAPASHLTIEVSPGELLDRTTIAALKASRINDPTKRQIAADELARLDPGLRQVLDIFGPEGARWRAELHDINARLWDLESELRAQIAGAADTQQLLYQAKEIARLNDLRADMKARVNHAAGSAGEVKDYGGVDVRPAPGGYRQVPDFLSPEEKEGILERIVLRRSEFEASGISSEAANYRASLVVVADPDTRALFVRRIADHWPLLVSIAGEATPLDPQKLECQITAHTDLCYFHVHSDNGSDAVRHRALTYVYYLRLRPGSFFGGELKIYPDRKRLDDVILVKPTDNSAVFFRSELLHEVIPTYVPSGAFEDSRFTVNGWVGV